MLLLQRLLVHSLSFLVMIQIIMQPVAAVFDSMSTLSSAEFQDTHKILGAYTPSSAKFLAEENRTAAGAFLMAQHEGQWKVLLGLRDDTQEWCNPGGASDDTDGTLAHTAARETGEETNGIYYFPPEYLSHLPSHDLVMGDLLYRMYIAVVQHVSEKILVQRMADAKAHEHKEYTYFRWFSMDELPQMVVGTGDQKLFCPLAKMLQARPVEDKIIALMAGRRPLAYHTISYDAGMTTLSPQFYRWRFSETQRVLEVGFQKKDVIDRALSFALPASLTLTREDIALKTAQRATLNAEFKSLLNEYTRGITSPLTPKPTKAMAALVKTLGIMSTKPAGAFLQTLQHMQAHLQETAVPLVSVGLSTDVVRVKITPTDTGATLDVGVLSEPHVELSLMPHPTSVRETMQAFLTQFPMNDSEHTVTEEQTRPYYPLLEQVLANEMHGNRVQYYHGLPGNLAYLYHILTSMRGAITQDIGHGLCTMRGTDLYFFNPHTQRDVSDIQEAQTFFGTNDYANGYPNAIMSANTTLMAHYKTTNSSPTLALFLNAESYCAPDIGAMFEEATALLGMQSSFQLFEAIFLQYLGQRPGDLQKIGALLQGSRLA